MDFSTVPADVIADAKIANGMTEAQIEARINDVLRWRSDAAAGLEADAQADAAAEHAAVIAAGIRAKFEAQIADEIAAALAAEAAAAAVAGGSGA